MIYCEMPELRYGDGGMCNEEASQIIEVDGERIPLCQKHLEEVTGEPVLEEIESFEN